MVELKLPTIENFLNYFPLDIGGYIIGGVNLAGNAFASILQLRRTISMNLKEFHGDNGDECKNSFFYSYNELMSANTVLSTFISFYLLTGVASKDATKILPFLLYVGTYFLTSVIHTGHVAFGFTLVMFHGYSFIVIYSILMNALSGKEDEKPEEEKLVKVDVEKPENPSEKPKEKIVEKPKKVEEKVTKESEKKIEKVEVKKQEAKVSEKKVEVKKQEAKKVDKKLEKSVEKPAKKTASKKDTKVAPKSSMKFPILKKFFHDKVEDVASSLNKKDEEKKDEENKDVEEEEEINSEETENDEQQDDEPETDETAPDKEVDEDNEELIDLEIVEESDLKDIEVKK